MAQPEKAGVLGQQHERDRRPIVSRTITRRSSRRASRRRRRRAHRGRRGSSGWIGEQLPQAVAEVFGERAFHAGAGVASATARAASSGSLAAATAASALRISGARSTAWASSRSARARGVVSGSPSGRWSIGHLGRQATGRRACSVRTAATRSTATSASPTSMLVARARPRSVALGAGQGGGEGLDLGAELLGGGEALEALGVLAHSHRELGLEGPDAPQRQLELLGRVGLGVLRRRPARRPARPGGPCTPASCTATLTGCLTAAAALGGSRVLLVDPAGGRLGQAHADGSDPSVAERVAQALDDAGRRSGWARSSGMAAPPGSTPSSSTVWAWSRAASVCRYSSSGDTCSAARRASLSATWRPGGRAPRPGAARCRRCADRRSGSRRGSCRTRMGEQGALGRASLVEALLGGRRAPRRRPMRSSAAQDGSWAASRAARASGRQRLRGGVLSLQPRPAASRHPLSAAAISSSVGGATGGPVSSAESACRSDHASASACACGSEPGLIAGLVHPGHELLTDRLDEPRVDAAAPDAAAPGPAELGHPSLERRPARRGAPRWRPRRPHGSPGRAGPPGQTLRALGADPSRPCRRRRARPALGRLPRWRPPRRPAAREPARAPCRAVRCSA